MPLQELTTTEAPTTVGVENTQPPVSNSHRISGSDEGVGPVPWADTSTGAKSTDNSLKTRIFMCASNEKQASLRQIENTLRPKRGQVGSSPLAGGMITVSIHAVIPVTTFPPARFSLARLSFPWASSSAG